jgi:PAS domain-containing protein
VRWPTGNPRLSPSDDGQHLLALVEAQVGQLVELLPVALLVTSAEGDILRANSAATALLGSSETLVGQRIDAVLRGHDLCVRVRIVSHQGDVVRLYVVQDRSPHAAFAG